MNTVRISLFPGDRPPASRCQLHRVHGGIAGCSFGSTRLPNSGSSSAGPRRADGLPCKRLGSEVFLTSQHGSERLGSLAVVAEAGDENTHNGPRRSTVQ